MSTVTKRLLPEVIAMPKTISICIGSSQTCQLLKDTTIQKFADNQLLAGHDQKSEQVNVILRCARGKLNVVLDKNYPPAGHHVCTMKNFR